MMFKINIKSISVKNYLVQLIVGAMVTTLSGCSSIEPKQGDQLRSRAFTPAATKTHMDLTSLPQSRGILRAAVYSFRDYSGQYKPQPSNGLSTAVTQGADAILINALLDSKWFAPVERSSLQNLLTERKILQSSLLDTDDDKKIDIPSVAPAEVIIEGSIVSYDSNTHTGGAGIRLLGLGGSTSYREDLVSISIRMVDIDNGLILHNVVSTKRIFSRKLDSGIFSYVDADKILETEAGYSSNEPSHIAVTEAIESALINLIADGIVSGTLQLANDKDVKSEIFERFLSKNERQVFIEQKRILADKQLEQKRFSNAVSKRMHDGISKLNEHTFRLQQFRSEQAKQANRPISNFTQVSTVKPRASLTTIPGKVITTAASVDKKEGALTL